MISDDDIDAFREASAGALAVADKVVARASAKAVPHRLVHANEELPVVRALRAYQQIIAWQAEAIAGYQQDAARRFDESVGCFSETGERTS